MPRRTIEQIWQETLAMDMTPASPVAISFAVEESTVRQIEAFAEKLPGSRRGDADEAARVLLAAGLAWALLNNIRSDGGLS